MSACTTAGRIEEMTDELREAAEREHINLDALEAFIVEGECGRATAEETIEAFLDAYCGEYRNLGDWAEEYLDSVGYLYGFPDELRKYFDFVAYGEDADCDGDIWYADSHYGWIFVFRNN